MLNLIFAVGAFALGACIASFLNVVIWRVPRGESIVSPPSHCPKCGTPIKGYQNIPILAWLFLRGKCAACKAPISPRYILIETLGGCLFLAAFIHVFAAAGAFVEPKFHLMGDPFLEWLNWFHLSVWWIWISLMIVGSMIDFDHKLLPDFMTVGGMILGVLWNGVVTIHQFANSSTRQFPDSVIQLFSYSVIQSLLGLAFGFGLFALIRLLGTKAFKREAMGMGDVFLMGAVGALFGPMAVLFVLIFSSLFGSVIGVSLIVLSKTKFGKFVEIPYGPYICLATLLWMFYGVEIVRWYLGLMK